ncbi:CPBP family intramembrane glutamic endopeptidase [Mesobacillus zeae]|uniref:CPBP family intramembrane metalloprotease n=1 Tax=Mesobacillus zeae TaxID=1917180 RepID=A0A398B0R5_9BACI|nr:type II CAAX endopeptidase family protein [Mesobacillus zeae]RID82894.1 CPBP family intramembrane metalloprotease [Mesobacillus zeae]
MKKEYWIILIAYIAMQFSTIIGVPLVMFIGSLMGNSPAEMKIPAVAFWLIFSFAATLLIVLFLLRKEFRRDSETRNIANIPVSMGWAFAGVFLALIAQATAASIESAIGVEMGSENTAQILRLIESFPFVMLVSSVIGPILEEIVFRKILFGSLYKRFNFLIAALGSSVIFALAHGEPEHILLYSAMGFTFAFLYVKTKRILVPIFAHVAMNTFVVLVQSVYKEDIERMMREAEKIQGFIGGFFL